jgi:hypothetical protein
MHPLLNQVGEQIRKEFAIPVPKIKNSKIENHEFEILKKESLTDSPFDPINLRKQIFTHVFYKKEGSYKVKESSYGKIIALFYNTEQEAELPWELWFRILRLFYKKRPFTICFLAHPSLREFPKKNTPISPFNINGGYTYPCNPSFICIYRAEDATRVLIHELFHASCSDIHEEGVDRVEAKTEAWAELIYCAIITKGVQKSFENQIKKQCAWMSMQNKHLTNFHMETSRQFPWRYTIGKEDIWKSWDIFYKDDNMSFTNSLRLTYPPTPTQKKQAHILSSSTML